MRHTIRSVGLAGASFTRPAREGAFTALAATGSARTAAYLARTLLRRAYASAPTKATTQASPSRRNRILVLPRKGLNDDLMSSLLEMESIEVVTLPRRVVKAMAAAFLPGEVDDNNYISASPAAQAAMANYRIFLTRFWQAFDPSGRIDAVVSGNFGYYAERELAGTLEALGVPFIALHKENSWSLGSQAFWRQVYQERRGRFSGRRILVYSAIERDLQVDAGVVDLDRIEVVGMPRLDVVHRWREDNIGRIPTSTVLFASFPSDVSMPVLKAPADNNGRRRGEPILALAGITQHRGVTELCTRAHRAILDLAVHSPEINIIVKSKGRARDRESIPRLFGVEKEADLPPNMQVMHGGSPLPFLAQAAVVGGLHSTLLLEALAAGRPVVIPWFAEVLDPVIRDYVFDLRPTVIHTSSPEEFAEVLRDLALAPRAVPERLSPEVLKILREWLGNDDGKAGERTAAAILRAIQAN